MLYCIVSYSVLHIVSSPLILQEYGAVRFEFDSGGPGVVEAWIPSVNSSGSTCAHWQPSSADKSMSTLIENFVELTNGGPKSTANEVKTSGSFSPTLENDQYSKLFMLKNKKPKWDDSHGGHVLNFQVCFIQFVSLFVD